MPIGHTSTCDAGYIMSLLYSMHLLLVASITTHHIITSCILSPSTPLLYSSACTPLIVCSLSLSLSLSLSIPLSPPRVSCPPALLSHLFDVLLGPSLELLLLGLVTPQGGLHPFACFTVFLVHACLHAPAHSAAPIHTSVTALPHCAATLRKRHTTLWPRLSIWCCSQYLSHNAFAFGTPHIPATTVGKPSRPAAQFRQI